MKNYHIVLIIVLSIIFGYAASAAFAWKVTNAHHRHVDFIHNKLVATKK